MEEIEIKANECLNCKNARCVQGCPINTRIPEFISKIKSKKLEEAYYILQENNALSSICAKICPTENQCMGACIKGIKGESVLINELENFVNEWAKENNIQYEISCEELNGMKVAVVGRRSSRNCAVV